MGDNAVVSLAVALASAVAGGIWFASAQVSALRNLSARTERIERDDETRRANVSGISDRLSRIEGNLDFLVQRVRRTGGNRTQTDDVKRHGSSDE